MKLYYFDLYGKAECIRMTLHKAKVQYEDVRVTGDSWKKLKASDKCMFGQVPLLELNDGTCLSQTDAILEYLGTVHNLKGADPLSTYKGARAKEYLCNDFLGNVKLGPIIFSPPGDERTGGIKNLAEVEVPKCFEMIVKCLSDDKKFLCGDSTTIYDFQVAGFLFNLILNPTSNDPEVWAKVWETAPDRLKKYADDFKEDMKDYLDSRVKGSTI